MTRLFVSNFHFEYELASPAFVPTRQLDEVSARNALSWTRIAQPGDVILLPDCTTAGSIQQEIQTLLPDVRVVIGRLHAKAVLTALKDSAAQVTPWGWTGSVLDFAARHGLSAFAPPLDVVRDINSRRFAFDLEQRSPFPLDHARLVTSSAELERALGMFAGDRRVLIKSEFGMSGRERLRVDVLDGRVDWTASQAGWLRRQFQLGLALVVEPLLAVHEEASVHYDVSPTGEVHRRGIVHLESDARGQFVRARAGDREEQAARLTQWAPVLPITDEAARQAARRGYFGPLGIDMMQYKGDDGSLRFRPLQDINARWTMGRLALEQTPGT